MAALTFDDLTSPAAGSGGGARTSEPAPKASTALSLDDLIPESNLGKAARIGKDVGMGLVSGLDKGVAVLAGLPADMALGVNAALNYGRAKLQGRPFDEVEAESDKNAFISRDAVRAWGSDAAHKNSPLYYKPTTQAGESTKNVAEFIPASLIGAGSLVKKILAYGLAPGVVAEAAGNVPGIKDSKAEPFVRAAAAIGTGVGAAVATSGGRAGKVLQNATEGVTQQHLDDAERLFEHAQAMGLPITRAEAVQHVTEGATGLANLQRVAEGSGAMRPYFAERAVRTEAAARNAFDDISAPSASPSAVGSDIRNAARTAVAETPEGRALSDAVHAAGPRMTPADAGTIIQPELAAVRDRREGMRAALAEQDYAAARNSPENVALDGGYSVRDVTSHYIPEPVYPVTRGSNGQMRRMTDAEIAAAEGRDIVPVHPVTRGDGGRMRRMTDEEIAAETSAREKQLEATRAQRQADHNITEPMPVIGLQPTKFGQIDATPVVTHLDEALATAKGAVKQGLTAARAAMFDSAGAVDTTVEGLHNARVAIDDLISQAKNAGANNTVAKLMDAKKALDKTLEGVPAYGEASRNFRAASEPLKPFEADRVPGRIVERNQYNDRFEMTPDQVAPIIERGGRAAAQDFNAVAPPAAREAFEQHLVTQVLEKARDKAGDVSADSIRKAMRTREDVIGEFPAVSQKLEAIAASRDRLDSVLATPIGRLADKDITTKRAIEVLFPRDPLAGSEGEIGKAVGALSQRNPNAARQLVRAHVEGVFNEASQRLASGSNEFGGAKFAAVVRGNPQQAANLEAAVRALPKGDDIWAGFERFLNIVEAQGQRQRFGSQTSFNNEVLADLKRGGVGDVVPIALGAGVKLPQRVADTWARWRLGKNVDELAYLLTDPTAGRRFRELIDAPQGGDRAAKTAARLSLLAIEGARSGKEK